MDATGIASEPLPLEPVRRRTYPGPRALAEVRLPIAGPYRPRARLVRLPSGELAWLVRLWRVVRAVAELVAPEVLRAYLGSGGLRDLLREVDAAVDRARRAEAPRA